MVVELQTVRAVLDSTATFPNFSRKVWYDRLVEALPAWAKGLRKAASSDSPGLAVQRVKLQRVCKDLHKVMFLQH